MLLAPSAAVLAAEYPTSPIQVAVAYGPGGATDFQARIATIEIVIRIGIFRGIQCDCFIYVGE